VVKRTVNPQQTNLARLLRRQQTDVEKILWNKLRNLQLDGIKFRRQHPVGKYIADFVSLDKKLVIEIDGSRHNGEQLK